MRKVIALITIILICGVMVQKAFSAGRAQSTTETTTAYGDLRKTTIVCYADSNGNLSNLATGTVFRGYILEVGIRSGAKPPNDNYGMSIKDVNGVDLLNGIFAVQDSATGSRKPPMAVANGDTFPGYPPVAGKLYLELSNSDIDSSIIYLDIFWAYK